MSEVDTEWYSDCCEAVPAYPGDVDEWCSAFCSSCYEGCGFHRTIAAFPKDDGIEFMLTQDGDGFYIYEEGEDENGEMIDMYNDQTPFEEFAKSWTDKELVEKMREEIVKAKQ